MVSTSIPWATLGQRLDELKLTLENDLAQLEIEQQLTYLEIMGHLLTDRGEPETICSLIWKKPDTLIDHPLDENIEMVEATPDISPAIADTLIAMTEALEDDLAEGFEGERFVPSIHISTTVVTNTRGVESPTTGGTRPCIGMEIRYAPTGEKLICHSSDCKEWRCRPA